MDGLPWYSGLIARILLLGREYSSKNHSPLFSVAIILYSVSHHFLAMHTHLAAQKVRDYVIIMLHAHFI